MEVIFIFKESIKLSFETTPQYAYRVLKENIMSLDLKPGELISETEVSKALNISRTPVREAIFNLKKENLVNVIPNKGSFVSLLDPKLIEEAQFMRTSLEVEVVKLACIEFPTNAFEELEKNLLLQENFSKFNTLSVDYFNLDNEFHKIIFEACNKSNVWNYITQMSSHLNRIRLLDAKSQPLATQITHEQHKNILKIISEKNLEEADRCIKDHIASFKSRYDALFREYPTFFLK